MSDYLEKLLLSKKESVILANLKTETRNNGLKLIAEALYKNREEIFKANQIDLEKAKAEYLPAPIISRLKFNEDKLEDVIKGIENLIGLEDPLNQKLLDRDLDENLNLHKVTCPIGVIGVIFESRPDALVQISSLCVKSGNVSILKGGSEAKNTNKILFDIIYDAGIRAGLPENFTILLESRENVDKMLALDEYVDLLIPRGSNSFVQYIMNRSKIPVMGHADGVCHIYVDDIKDLKKTIDVIVDSKIQYVSACNTVETLLVHKKVAEKLLPVLQKRLNNEKVEMRGCEKTREIIDCQEGTEDDFRTEYLDYIIAVKIVEDMAEAISHINQYGSHHTDCIITSDKDNSDYFMNMVDSANVYCNCSTRFADGFRYGFGAEVGISTGKLHARGPVGLDGLVTYKYKVYGDGHLVEDYSSGKKDFHFKDK